MTEQERMKAGYMWLDDAEKMEMQPTIDQQARHVISSCCNLGGCNGWLNLQKVPDRTFGRTGTNLACTLLATTITER